MPLPQPGVSFLTILAAIAGTAFVPAAAIAQELDLNANLVHDSEDIQLGVSGDCNFNGLVDERDAGAPHVSVAVEQINAVEQFQNNVWDARPIDFNQDGMSDLVVTSMLSTNVGAVSFWRNEGGPGLVHVERIEMPDSRPFVIRVGLLNDDDLPDIVMSDSSYNRAYVMLATGAETFAPAVTLNGTSANNGSVGLDIGDLDNDGDTDIVFSTWYPAMLTTFLNDGDGNFTMGTSFTTDRNPRDVDLADVNGDGLLDIATACEHTTGPVDDGAVAIHTNNGDGTFTWHSTITMPKGDDPYNYRAKPQYVELADINGDGTVDLVTSSDSSNLLTIHTNDGTGSFTLAQSLGGWWLGLEASDILLHDFDSDGWIDLAWGDIEMASARLFRNNAGVFEAHQDYAVGTNGPHTLAAADFTGDGLTDLVASNNYSRTFSVVVNIGGLNFDAAIHFRPEEYPTDPVMADFNEDGLIDLGMAHSAYLTSDTTFTVYPGMGDAVFAKTGIDTQLSTVAGHLHAVDVNHDGHMDLINFASQAFVRLGNGDGTFGTEIASPINVALRHMLDDYNNDGELDVAWLFSSHPSILRVSFGDGAGHFAPYSSYTDVAEDESIGSGDINGDGVPEVITGHRFGIVSIHPNQGDGTFGTRRDITIVGDVINPKIDAIAIADFDGDSDNDVIVTAFGLAMFTNPGDGNLPEVPVAVAMQPASILEPVDADLDGDIDLFGRNASGIIYLNAGDGFFDVEMLLPRYESITRWLTVADANNDGRQDLLIGPENGWGQYLYLNLPPQSTDQNANAVLDECEAPVLCPGDGTGDAVVDINDLNQVLGNFGTIGPAGDVDGSGFVDVQDLNLVVGNFGAACI